MSFYDSDTKGPEIRIKDFKEGSVSLVQGQLFTLTEDIEEIQNEQCYV